MKTALVLEVSSVQTTEYRMPVALANLIAAFIDGHKLLSGRRSGQSMTVKRALDILSQYLPEAVEGVKRKVRPTEQGVRGHKVTHVWTDIL